MHYYYFSEESSQYIVKRRSLRTAMMVLRALPKEMQSGIWTYVKENHNNAFGRQDFNREEKLPDVCLFDEDIVALSELNEEQRLGYFLALVDEKRFILQSQYEHYAAPQLSLPQLKDNNAIESVQVRLWMPEISSISVTLFMDAFVSRFMPYGGFLYLFPEDTKYIGIHSIEDMSSGFKIVNTGVSEKNDFVRIEVSQVFVKYKLTIPNSPFAGFAWETDNSFFSKEKGTHDVPIFRFGHKYILSIPVCGEFGLGIYYQPRLHPSVDKYAPIHFLMGREFYCK